MIVSGLDSETIGGTKLVPDNAKQVLGKDDFLNLLVAQLQHQDPLNPMDSTQFTSQLAEFSSLEQLSNINTQLKELQVQQQETRHTQSMDYIGKTVVAEGDRLWLEAGNESELSFELAAGAAAAQVNIYDAAGEYVRSLEASDLPAGRRSVSWDGRDAAGRSRQTGPYTFEVLAVDADGNMVKASPLVMAQVTGVRFENGRADLVTRGQTIPVQDVREVINTEL